MPDQIVAILYLLVPITDEFQIKYWKAQHWSFRLICWAMFISGSIYPTFPYSKVCFIGVRPHIAS